MVPTRVIKAFATDGEYQEYKRLRKPTIIGERKLRTQDLINVSHILVNFGKEKLEEVTDVVMQMPNSIKVAFSILTEIASLRSKDGFGELSINQKPAMYAWNIEIFN